MIIVFYDPHKPLHAHAFFFFATFFFVLHIDALRIAERSCFWPRI